MISTFCAAEGPVTATVSHRSPFAKMVIDPSDHKDSDLSLTEYPLAELQLSGILQQGTESRAIFRDRRGRLHQLKIGDAVGLEQAKITAIFADKIMLASQPELKSPVTTVLTLP